jgi:hypothetical protein
MGRKRWMRLAPARFDLARWLDLCDRLCRRGRADVEVRVQALFGLARHPMLGDGTPLVLSLTSPAGRPIQTTRDLPGFWKGKLGGGRQGDARALSAPSLARRPRRRFRDAQDKKGRCKGRRAALKGFAMTKTARIYQMPKNAMQSGRARTTVWILEYEPVRQQQADPLTGWAGGDATATQLRMSFPTLEAATGYAEREGIAFHVVAAPERKLKLQAYADNFR